MSVFIVIRHSRADEEAGRLELIGSARVGRQAPLVSAIGVAALANVVIAAVLCVVLPLLGLPAAGSVALSLAIGTCGLAFTGIAAVTAQLASGARAARGLAFGVLGVAFLARAVGDSAGGGGPAWLTWVLPLGWTEEIRPFAGERWWVLALPLALCAAGVGLAFALAARRDYGAGLLPDRPGRPFASGLLRGPFSLAWRLQWGTLAAWAAGYAILFAVCGAAGKGIGQLVGSSGALEKEFTRLGGQAAIVNAYLASLMLLAGLGAAGYAVCRHAAAARGRDRRPRGPGAGRRGRQGALGAQPRGGRRHRHGVAARDRRSHDRPRLRPARGRYRLVGEPHAGRWAGRTAGGAGDRGSGDRRVRPAAAGLPR